MSNLSCMADEYHDGVLLVVDVNYNGVFVTNPRAYVGDRQVVTDQDFAGMDLDEFATFLERFVGTGFQKIFYCQRDRPLSTGIRFIEDDLDYAHWLDEAYEEPERPISIYLDHDGDGLNDWVETSTDSHGSVIQSERRPDAEGDSHGQGEGQGEEQGQGQGQGGQQGQGEGAGQRNVNLNTPEDEAFLNKLVPDDPTYDPADDEEEDDELLEQPIYNPELNWKLQEPQLGMRFESPTQLKDMLCNYAVSKGYQLTFEKNDKKRLLVLCSKGECPFRLWASWMSDEYSFQIKSLKEDHNCARNYKLGSIVNYKWLGAHYTKEIIHRQKLTIRQLRVEVVKKFGIQVSLGQCRRAKQHALTIIEGTLTEHYARLWSYGAEIRRSNPGSNVRLSVERGPDDKCYFSKMYVCFDGVKKGWIEGCRRVIGLDGCFLKGICKGELLCVVGRDANNQLYPIAWAVVCVESKQTWKWFLDLLIDDLELHRGNGLTLMSDQHKVSFQKNTFKLASYLPNTVLYNLVRVY